MTRLSQFTEEMIESDLSLWRCSLCRSALLAQKRLQPRGAQRGEVEQILMCSSCGEEFPIVAGIPRFVRAANYAHTFGFQWKLYSKTQLDSHTGLSISRDRLFAVTGWPQRILGERILEAGSGAGRFTEVLAETGANVYSFDFSVAVEANHDNSGGKSNVQIFQADIFHIPLETSAFEKVICLGVLQHTPDPEGAFRSLAKYVKPGGQLVIDVYRRSSLTMLQWKYVLRPITRRIKKETLYRLVASITPRLIRPARLLRKFAGRAGARMVPIVEYSHLGLSPELNTKWAILDTFDMYSPTHDHPQSVSDVHRWFREAGFVNVHVAHGPNGVIGRGLLPR